MLTVCFALRQLLKQICPRIREYPGGPTLSRFACLCLLANVSHCLQCTCLGSPIKLSQSNRILDSRKFDGLKSDKCTLAIKLTFYVPINSLFFCEISLNYRPLKRIFIKCCPCSPSQGVLHSLESIMQKMRVIFWRPKCRVQHKVRSQVSVKFPCCCVRGHFSLFSPGLSFWHKMG